MQSAAVERNVVTSGMMAKSSFGISHSHAAHIMGILRSTLYSRKALAVLREYGSNAWDEHRQSGQHDRPIHVTLPTAFKPTLKIRDFGRGLSEHDVLNIYTQYGESTKRDTNDAAGMLGIGCKAGFCYSDTFTVSSWHQGTKSVYVAVLDKSNAGEMQKVHEEPCEETGIEIQIAVRPKDVEEFIKEARGLFRYFSPQPIINLPLPGLPKGMTHGFVREDNTHEWIAVMGCIPYRLDLDQLKAPLVDQGLWDALEKLSGGLYLSIGAVEFSASREELQYTEVTIQVLIQKFVDLVQEYIDDALKALSQPNVSGWDRRLKANFMQYVLKFPLPPAFKPWTETGVPLYAREKSTPTSFHLVDGSGNNITRVLIKQDVHILIKDDPRSLKGWHFNNQHDVLAIPNEGFTYDQVVAEIRTLCAAAKLDGIPWAPLTTRAYWSHYVNGRKRYETNSKHKDRTFILQVHFSDSSPRSKWWDHAKPPADEHVFVIISEFLPRGTTMLDMIGDQALAKEFNIPWPTIYGYKTTAKLPVKAEDIEKGTPYTTWREKAFGSLVTDQVKADLRAIAWYKLFGAVAYHHNTFPSWVKTTLVGKLTEDLGAQHSFTRYFSRYVEMSKEVSKFPRGHANQVLKLARVTKYMSKRSPPYEWLNRILETYPMLKVGVKSDSDLTLLVDHYATVIAYIKDQDSLSGLNPNTSRVVAPALEQETLS